MNKKVYFYFHAGSSNHGCEAIVRSTQKLLQIRPVLMSDSPDQDRNYAINRIADVKSYDPFSYSFLEKAGCAFTQRLFHSEAFGYHIRAKYESKSLDENSIAFSIGGDNYCYGEGYNLHLDGLNRELHKRHIKTVLWGCSIEPSTVSMEMKKDFSRYDLIVARENISYHLLRQCNRNTILACDPAFTLGIESVDLPEGLMSGEYVGINISPLVQKKETIPGITLDNYDEMIDYILKNTVYKVALIPHVVAPGNDDREPLKKIYDRFKDSGRVFFIHDDNCMRLKDIISKCSLFIGARTHATIAAYSTGVPTLVIGYSTKARGIAEDLFGTSRGYVLPVQSLKEKKDMMKAFIWLNQHQREIHSHLLEVLPGYLDSMNRAVQAVKEIIIS